MEQLQSDHHHHHRRLKPEVKSENQQHQQHHQQQQQPTPQQQQPQKCPRCDSPNTKFCYYNNYSLSQPRYFCKNCKRYWTQGGTLRNVPVGGGCRKGKRPKPPPSSGGENSRSQPPPPPQPPQGTMLATNSYYSGGGFLSSLAAMQSLSQSQPFNLGGQFGGSSNLDLLHGFKVPSFRSQQAQNQQIHQQNEFYPSDQSLVQPNRPIGSWSFFNNGGSTNPCTASNPSFLNSNTTKSSTTGTSLNPNQWADLQGYGPPP